MTELLGKIIPILIATSAIELYKQALNAKILEIHFDENNKNIVMHAAIQIGDSLIYIDDVQSNSIAGGNVLQTAKLCVYVENAEESFDKAINKGMKVEMPLGDMPWSYRFGVVKDEYGIQWCFSSPLKK
ncbi:VOC family protein [Wolbachia endosymbiont (group A) of Lypha dubia]|uniref:VOC family protein n=1 Tax=Wolbachia endosymbiont (group A) of Lypha dubia TaxID=3066146 RepID=UPI00334097EA